MKRRSRLSVLLVCSALGLAGGNCPPSPPDPSPGLFVVAAFGDSLTAATPFGGYAGALAASAVPEWSVLDEGIPAECGAPHYFFLVCSEHAFGAQRLRDAVSELRSEPGIDAVVAMWGTNDAGAGVLYAQLGMLEQWRTDFKDPYVHDILEALAHARIQGVDSVYVFPPRAYGEDAELRNPLLQEIQAALVGPLAALGAATVDLYAASEADPSMIGADGLHFSAPGAAKAAALVAAALESLD